MGQFDISEELKKLPQKPGVYIMKDNHGQVIYVGKTISLKNRVRQYFQASNQKSNSKVKALAERIDEFEYIITDNEVEALILEANLIKKHQPTYNILLKDDKQYPYIKITVKEKYPRVFKTREIKKDGAKYYGPYPSGKAVNDILEMIRKTYPLRTCKLRLNGEKVLERPCLNYHIGRCIGPCQGNIDVEDYRKIVDDIRMFLEGREDGIIKKLMQSMKEASMKLDFEKAAEYRDQIKAIETLKEEQKATQVAGKDQDVIGLAKGQTDACVQIFFVRQGKIVGREHFMFTDVENEDRSSIMSAFIKQFYAGEAYIPLEIYSEEPMDDQDTIEEWLRTKKERKVKLKVPQKGIKNNLIKLVHLNALETLNKHLDRHKKQAALAKNGIKSLADILKIDEVDLKRIEAYDISNTQGTNSVGALVVFENGTKKQSDYRRFKIRTVEGSDDYGSMQEVLYRRFRNYIEKNDKFSALPDLIMMDGGKGQINIAEGIISQLGLDIKICGLVKDNKHRTRGIIYKNEEITIDKHSEAFKLITRIQDEVHRFAISYHRSLRDKNMVKSELDNIEGIGPKRKKALFKEFKTLSNMKKQTIESLSEVDGMNKKSAEAVYRYFRK